jgi:TolB-like protein
MKRSLPWVILLVCLFTATPLLWAKDHEVVAVLPFSINSAENIDYVRQGIVNMLTSRLSGNERIEIVGKDQIQTALKGTDDKELAQDAINALGKKLAADFVVSGTITKIGNSLNIDGKLSDIAAAKAPLIVSIQCQSMDEVIPKITDFARKIDAQISGATLPVVASPQSSKEIIVSRQPAPQPSREAEIISGMRGSKKGTLTAGVNPDFINAEQPLNRDTFWKSPQVPYEYRGLDIGDVNGDGLNETVLIDQNNVFIYQRRKNDFVLLQQIAGKSYDNYIAVDVADVNGNGIKEIIISNQVNKVINSFVIEFKNGQFVTIASELRWLMRVIDDGSRVPLLLGQRVGFGKVFETPIHEIIWQNGAYREGQKMKIPEGLSIYGLTIAKLTPGGSDRIIALDQDDYLCVFEPTDKPLSRIVIFGGSNEFLWKSEDAFGGSNTFIESASNSAGGNASGSTSDDQGSTYINLRILTYDTNRDGKKEIIVVKNLSASGRLFQRIKLFTSAEVYDLEWDAMGIVENWRTKKISGYVSDFQFKDIDNDGENEVVLSLVLSVGGSLRGRSVVIAYDLKGQ